MMGDYVLIAIMILTAVFFIIKIWHLVYVGIRSGRKVKAELLASVAVTALVAWWMSVLVKYWMVI